MNALSDTRYRHEWKHELNTLDYLTIRRRLQAVMKRDPHAVDGRYFVRSLYFDSPDDKALREKADGVNMREKFRIRYYNGDTSFIRLEKKARRCGLGAKFSAELTREEAQAIVDGDIGWMMASGRPLVQEFYCKMRYQCLKPKTIVDYTREAYVYGPGHVRVTFDFDIRTGLSCTDFLDPGVTIPAGDAPQYLIEVKWDEYLPEIVRAAVQTPGRRAAAFSKYAQSRIYG
ncbi:MAG: polyphosphate polymerase domain-containing protein [Oscillospiraceae bacterium]|nr:polyphosphate polymerase domain-containing protein [Oscillospiraceae bacterium]